MDEMTLFDEADRREAMKVITEIMYHPEKAATGRNAARHLLKFERDESFRKYRPDGWHEALDYARKLIADFDAGRDARRGAKGRCRGF